MNKNNIMYAIILFSVLLGAMRATGFKGIIFQAVAHLWVGSLFGFWLATKKTYVIAVFVILSAIELIVFLSDKI